MLEIIKSPHFPFMRYRRYAYALSALFLLVGLASIIARPGFRMGVDFTGGRLVEYRFSQPVPVDRLRAALAGADLGEAEIQQVGDTGRDFLIRLPVTEEQIGAQTSPSVQILERLKAEMPGLEGELRKEELVGPRTGRELRGKAFWAVTVSLIGILLYVGIRYQFTFAVGGVVGLAFDVLVTLLLLSLFDKEITIPIVAALLTTAGFSINDKVVVFDRIREESRLRQGQSLSDLIDLAINKTLSRTMLSNFTVFLTAAFLFFLGGPVIHDFAFAMMIGVSLGTYSSVYVASALTLALSRSGKATRKAAAA